MCSKSKKEAVEYGGGGGYWPYVGDFIRVVEHVGYHCSSTVLYSTVGPKTMNNFFKFFYRRCGKKQQQMHDILVALEIQKILHQVNYVSAAAAIVEMACSIEE